MGSHSRKVTAAVVFLLLAILAFVPGRPVMALQRSVPNLDIMLITDQSLSMWNYNDTDHWRIEMVNLFISLMGVEKSGAAHRLGMVYFGTDASLIFPLTPTDDFSNMASAARDNNRAMGATEMPDAISLAFQELQQRGRPDARKAIVFLTDGHCEVQGRPNATPECNRNVRDMVNQNKGDQDPASTNHISVYSIAFTDEAQSNDSDSMIYKTLLEEIASTSGGRYFEPDNAKDDLLRVYMEIIQDLLGLEPPDPGQRVVAPTEVIFTVASNLYQVVFTAVKDDPGIGMVVLDPDGAMVNDGYPQENHRAMAGKTEVVSVKNPKPGNWRIQLSGNGAVTVLLVPFVNNQNQLNLLQPSGAHPWGKPMNLIAQVVDANNTPVVVDNLAGEVTYPDGQVKPVTISRGQDNFYRGVVEDTGQIGSYTIHFSAQATGTQAGVDTVKTISVVRAPWIKINEPLEGAVAPISSDIPISAQLMWGIDPLVDPANTGEYIVRADIYQAENLAQLLSQNLELGVNGVFSSTFKAEQEMPAHLSVVLTFTTPSGETFIDVAESNFVFGPPVPATPTAIPPTAVPTETNTPVPPPPTFTAIPKPTATPRPPIKLSGGAVAGIIIGLLAAAGAGGAGYWFYNLPSLDGSSMDFNGGTTYLRGKKPVYIGSDARSEFVVTDVGILPRHAMLRPIGSRKTPQVELNSLDISSPVDVNGFPTTIAILKDGDKIQVGSQVLRFTGAPQYEFTDTQPNLDDLSSGH